MQTGVLADLVWAVEHYRAQHTKDQWGAQLEASDFNEQYTFAEDDLHRERICKAWIRMYQNGLRSRRSMRSVSTTSW
jgi:hypothetical protein